MPSAFSPPWNRRTFIKGGVALSALPMNRGLRARLRGNGDGDSIVAVGASRAHALRDRVAIESAGSSSKMLRCRAWTVIR